MTSEESKHSMRMEFEKTKQDNKKELMLMEHDFKMQRLDKQLEIEKLRLEQAKLGMTGKTSDEE